MRWIKDDTELLKSWGYSQKDIEQIKEARKFLVLTTQDSSNEDKEIKISKDKAIELLGRETFLSGLARASFHFTSVRSSDEYEDVFFDCSRMFKE